MPLPENYRGFENLVVVHHYWMIPTASHWMLVEGTDSYGDVYETIGDIWWCVSITPTCPDGETGSVRKKDLDDAVRDNAMIIKCTESHTMGRFEDVVREEI